MSSEGNDKAVEKYKDQLHYNDQLIVLLKEQIAYLQSSFSKKSSQNSQLQRDLKKTHAALKLKAKECEQVDQDRADLAAVYEEISSFTIAFTSADPEITEAQRMKAVKNL